MVFIGDKITPPILIPIYLAYCTLDIRLVLILLTTRDIIFMIYYKLTVLICNGRKLPTNDIKNMFEIFRIMSDIFYFSSFGCPLLKGVRR